AQYLGKIGPARIPDGVHVLPTQVSIAAQLPHATGLAWGLRLRGQDSVVIAYIGDGGSSEGDFHEALNLAGVVKAPIVFFLQNNQWAISTSRRVQSATRSFALRAAGYGLEGVEVDGNDVMAVYDVTSEAVARARGGGGPSLIEAVTYRMGFHNTTDNPSRYQDPTEYEEARSRDPIERVQKYLAALGLWDANREAALTGELRDENDRALQLARSAATPLAEASTIGASLGLAIAGMVPVAEIQFLGFTAQGFHQLGPQLGKYRQRSRGRYHCQVTIRAPFGGGIKSPEFHSDAVEAQ